MLTNSGLNNLRSTGLQPHRATTELVLVLAPPLPQKFEVHLKSPHDWRGPGCSSAHHGKDQSVYEDVPGGNVIGVGVAAFSLVVDFKVITNAVAQGIPQRESWRLAFGLPVSPVWLYT